MILKENIEKLIRRENLTSLLCQQLINEIFNPQTPPVQIAALMVLLRSKGETAEELFAIVKTLRDKIIRVSTSHTVLDIVGTGGDGFHTVNISTGSAILAASTGIKIAKHGNRAVSSLSGSADVLEALGINIKLTPEKISKSIDQIGIGFCYSPNFHPEMLALKGLRQTLNVPTTFNYLGPFLNPVSVQHMLLGVADEKLLSPMADVLILLNTQRSVIFHSLGLDEIHCAGPTKIIEINERERTEYELDPKKLGLTYCTLSDLRGGSAATNATLLLDVFKGKKGPIANTLMLNVAVALYIYGTCASIAEGLAFAQDTLASGKSLTLLNNWIEFSHAQ